MRTMALPYHHNKANIFVEAEKLAVDGLVWLVSIFSRIPWIFALLLVVTVGLAYTIVCYLPLVWLRRKNRSLLASLLEDLDNVEERDLMEFHLDLEDTVKKLRSVRAKGNSFFVFKPLNSELAKLLDDTNRAERIVFDRLYPDYDKELTKEQESELIEAFKPWKEEPQRHSSVNG
jgi:hypothetical protein